MARILGLMQSNYLSVHHWVSVAHADTLLEDNNALYPYLFNALCGLSKVYIKQNTL